MFLYGFGIARFGCAETLVKLSWKSSSAARQKEPGDEHEHRKRQTVCLGARNQVRCCRAVVWADDVLISGSDQVGDVVWAPMLWATAPTSAGRNVVAPGIVSKGRRVGVEPLDDLNQFVVDSAVLQTHLLRTKKEERGSHIGVNKICVKLMAPW
jgi:hypothetical protein